MDRTLDGRLEEVDPCGVEVEQGHGDAERERCVRPDIVDEGHPEGRRGGILRPLGGE